MLSVSKVDIGSSIVTASVCEEPSVRDDDDCLVNDAASSGGVSTPLKARGVMLRPRTESTKSSSMSTPSKPHKSTAQVMQSQVMESKLAAPERSSTPSKLMTPSKLEGSVAQVTQSQVAWSKSAAPGRSSSPSKLMTPSKLEGSVAQVTQSQVAGSELAASERSSTPSKLMTPSKLEGFVAQVTQSQVAGSKSAAPERSLTPSKLMTPSKLEGSVAQVTQLQVAGSKSAAPERSSTPSKLMTPSKLEGSVAQVTQSQVAGSKSAAPSKLMTPSKLEGSSVKSAAQITPSKSPGSKGAKVKSPGQGKSSTPSKSSVLSKSPMSSPRQRSLLEMFTHCTATSSSNSSAETSSPPSDKHSPAADALEGGQKLDASPPAKTRPVGAEVLVEDSQMAGTSPVRAVVDTQESMFVDDTPPKSSDSDVTACSEGNQFKAACNSIGDTCDADSLPDDEVSQQTVVHVDAGGDGTLSQVGATSTLLTASDVDKLSTNVADGIGSESASLTAISASTVTKISNDDAGHTQHDVIDLTQISSLDPTAVDPTQTSSLGCTQFAVDRIHDALDDVEASSTNDDDAAVDAEDDFPLFQLMSSDADDENVTTTDAEDDVPLIEMTQSHDAKMSVSSEDDFPLSHLYVSRDGDGTSGPAFVPDDDLPLSHLEASRDDDGNGGPASVHSSFQFGHRRRMRRDRKDAVHATIEGRVSRHVLETRPTRLNLRTRSIRRMTDELVSAGAKKIDVLPPQLPGVRRRGRPKRSSSSQTDTQEVTHGQNKLALHPHPPHRTLSKRSCKSVWMRVAAAESDVVDYGKTRDEDFVESTTTQKSRAVIDNCDKVDEIVELQPDAKKERTAKRVAAEDSDMVNYGRTSDEDLVESTRTRKSQADGGEDEAGGEKVGDGDAGMRYGIASYGQVCEIVELDPDAEEERNGGIIASGGPSVISTADVSVRTEKPDDDGDVEPAESAADVGPTTGDETLAPESCGKPESGINSSPETAVNDMIVPPAATTDEEQCSSRLSSSEIVTDDIAVDAGTVNSDIRNDTPASGSATNKVAVLVSVSDSSGDRGTTQASGKCGVEPTTADDKEVPETRMDVEKSPPASDDSGECRWKVPTSSVSRGQPAVSADAPPETPTSVPRRRFVTRGSLMLERAKQFRQSATSPAVKSARADHSSEDDVGGCSPSSVDRRGSDGLSKLQVFSPAASPSAGILRKRQRSSASAASSGPSPSPPPSRVSHLHP